MNEENNITDKATKSAKRRGAQPHAKAPCDLPKPILSEIHRLAVGSVKSVTEIDAMLQLSNQGIKLGTLQKYVGRLRRTAGVIAGPRGPGNSRGKVDTIAATLHAFLAASFPREIVEAVARRLLFTLSVDAEQVVSLAQSTVLSSEQAEAQG